jgi:hypothetical protein
MTASNLASIFSIFKKASVVSGAFFFLRVVTGARFAR